MVEKCRTEFFDKSIARMISVSAGASAVILILFEILQSGECLRCYECDDRLRPGETSACLTGDVAKLKQVDCTEPSVCISLRIQVIIFDIPGTNRVTRACQPLRRGCYCESEYDENLSMFCSMCTSDLCNYSKDDSNLSTSVTVNSDLCKSFALNWDIRNSFMDDWGDNNSSSTIKTIPLVITMIYALAWLCI